MNIYFAGPLFNEADRLYNEKVVSRLRDEGHDVFLPQEEAIITDFDKMTQADLSAIFKKDVAHILCCDIVVVNTNGTDVDSGSAVEIGIAYMQRKPAILLHTECRGRINNMIRQVATYTAESIEELVRYLHNCK